MIFASVTGMSPAPGAGDIPVTDFSVTGMSPAPGAGDIPVTHPFSLQIYYLSLQAPVPSGST
jgi:hypothetical protein